MSDPFVTLHKSLSEARERLKAGNDALETAEQRKARERRQSLETARRYLEAVTTSSRFTITSGDLQSMARILLALVKDSLEREPA